MRIGEKTPQKRSVTDNKQNKRIAMKAANANVNNISNPLTMRKVRPNATTDDLTMEKDSWKMTYPETRIGKDRLFDYRVQKEEEFKGNRKSPVTDRRKRFK